MSTSIFRFLGEMPRGRFEFSCLCGKSNLDLIIPFDEDKATFVCQECGTEVMVWQQRLDGEPHHWHMQIIPKS